jgi:hypothetical protein
MVLIILLTIYIFWLEIRYFAKSFVVKNNGGGALKEAFQFSLKEHISKCS